MATQMWDLYLVVHNQMVRCGLHEDGGLTEPIARIKIKPGAKRLEWLEDAGAIVLYGDEQTIMVDQSLNISRNLPPLAGVSPDGQLAFALDGPGPTHDLLVLPLSDEGKKPLRLANLDLINPQVHFVPAMDVMLCVDGDPGTTVPRNILVVPLQQLRNWIDDGTTHADRNALDYDVINGAKEHIPLAKQHLKIRAIPDHPGFIIFWNEQTGGSVTEGQMAVIEYLYWDGDEEARGQIRQNSGPMGLPRFWLSDLMMERSPTGGLVVYATGVGRKAGDFYLALRKMAVMEPEEGVRYAMSQSTFDESLHREIELRNADALKFITPLPLGAGVMFLCEDPYRESHLIRLDVKASGAKATKIPLDVTPGPFVAVGERLIDRARLAGQKRATPRRMLNSGYTGSATEKVSLLADDDDDETPTSSTGGWTGNMSDAPDTVDTADTSDSSDDDVYDAEVVEPTAPLALNAAAAQVVHQAPAPAVTVTSPPAEAHIVPPPRAAIVTPPPAAAATPNLAPMLQVVSTGGPLPVMPGPGFDLPLGVLPANAHLAVTVTVVGGDARSAELRWWLSQAPGQGDVVYTLHLRAAVQTMVRWSAKKL